MQYEGQKLWRSAIKLVSRNRRRGYCIARALVEENLEVSTLHGTFRIKEPLHDEISENKLEFVKKLFESLMKQVYRDNVISDFSVDVPHLLNVLDVGALHEILGCYHATQLTLEGRAWLSIKMPCIFKDYIIESDGTIAIPKIQTIY